MMNNNTQPMLVTSALPYANGPLHLGHLLETIQADIWVRYQKLRGRNCVYVCADDAHGTAIMLTAEKHGISAEQQITNVQREHQADFAGFLIGFDNYYTTHSDECRAYTEQVYRKLRDQDHIISRDIKQLYDPEKKMFLADRYIKGQCPRCDAEEQYGDHCEVCNATYHAADLIDPVSVISGATPVEKNSTHYFFALPQFTSLLKDWVQAGHLQPAVANKLSEWIEAGLHEWDISRDAPYFGFEIPDAPNKYFYVWLDAPLGYMASFEQYCQHNNVDFDNYWQAENADNTELYHFIGKDIIHFHGLFWPAVLNATGYRTPTAIYAHGFLTVNGKKMSKSRGTFIKAQTYLSHLDPEYLRYYYAAKLSSGIDDIDLNFDDFMQRVNTDLVGKIVNIASRCAKFISQGSDGVLANHLHDNELWQQAIDAGKKIADHYQAREYSKAVNAITALADATNSYINHWEPWKLAKQAGQEQLVIDVCSQCINLFRLIIIYLRPILPAMAESVVDFLNDPLAWDQALQPLLSHTINPFTPLMNRVDKEQIEAVIADSKETA